MTATEVLTAVLVLVTGYYAFQNRQMVREMAKTRAIAVLPSLSLSWEMLGPVNPVPAISNVGPGPALDVDVAITYVPIDGSSEDPIVVRWQSNLMVAGERNEFLTPEGVEGSMMQTEELANRFLEVRLTGKCLDVLGNAHEVDDTLSDIAAWKKMSSESQQRWQSPDQEKRLAKAFAEEFKRKFAPLLKSLGG